MNGLMCVLEDGRRVRFALKKRPRDPFYLVAFRGPDGSRLERSTKEPSQRRATESATAIIQDEFATKPVVNDLSWDEARDVIVRHMQARNLRPATIDDYRFTLNTLQQAFPKTKGPADITPMMAERYKIFRLKLGKAVWTVKRQFERLERGLRTLASARVCKIVTSNPFADIEPPKVERNPPRIIAPEEVQAFFDWLKERWLGWRFPLLFLEVKRLVGCRITELASAATDGLRDGRIRFEAGANNEGPKAAERKVAAASLRRIAEKIAGKKFVFGAFATQLRRVHIKRGNPHHAISVGDFSPGQLRAWLQDEKSLYFEAGIQPQSPFKLHNLRGTAMSKARMAGVGFDDAAIAFGCHPETMRKHYVALDETEISDRVMDKIQGCNGLKSGEKNGEKMQADNKNHVKNDQLDEKSGEI